MKFVKPAVALGDSMVWCMHNQILSWDPLNDGCPHMFAMCTISVVIIAG